MNRFVTTYRQDYEWPRSIHGGLTYATDVKPLGKLCPCGEKSQKKETPTARCKEALLGSAFEWSRLGPMGPLLDPKLYPARPTPMPKIEAPKFERQEEHMRELAEKYPYLEEVFQCAPSNELFQSVDEDRLKSSYQQQFADPETGIFKYHDSLQPAKGMDSLRLPSCSPAETLVRAEDTKVQRRPSPEKYVRESRRVHEEKKVESSGDSDSRKKRKRREDAEEEEEEEESKDSLPEWKSEYQDVIAQTGEAIMRYGMHCPKKKGSSRAKFDD